MRLTVPIASTAIVKRGEVRVKLSLESLEGAAETTGVPMIVDHNPLFMPLGKTEEAWVEKQSDSEGILYQKIYFETVAPIRQIDEDSLTEIVLLRFAGSPGKFHIGTPETNNSMSVDFSAMKCGGIEALRKDILNLDEPLTIQAHDRRSEIPVPLVQFVADTSLSGILMTMIKIYAIRVAIKGKPDQWIIETGKWIVNTVARAIESFRKYKTKKAKQIGKEFLSLLFDTSSFNGPIVELVIPASDDFVISASIIEDLSEQISKFANLLMKCDKVVFAYSPNENKCEFRYGYLKTGGVVGTVKCYKESSEAIWPFIQDMVIWGTLTRSEDEEIRLNLYRITKNGIKSWVSLQMSPDTKFAFNAGPAVNDGKLWPFQIRKVDEGHFTLEGPVGSPLVVYQQPQD